MSPATSLNDSVAPPVERLLPLGSWSPCTDFIKPSIGKSSMSTPTPLGEEVMPSGPAPYSCGLLLSVCGHAPRRDERETSSTWAMRRCRRTGPAVLLRCAALSRGRRVDLLQVLVGPGSHAKQRRERSQVVVGAERD